MRPYQEQALDYLTLGIGYPIPSTMPFEKFPPLTGWTVKQGHNPDGLQVEVWRNNYPK